MFLSVAFRLAKNRFDSVLGEQQTPTAKADGRQTAVTRHRVNPLPAATQPLGYFGHGQQFRGHRQQSPT
jgi:hypothetical protein